MPHPKCKSITASGIQCTNRARENDKCGIHKHTALATSIYNLKRRITFIYSLDYMNVLMDVRRPHMWVPESIDEGLFHITTTEELIRPLYPDYTGDFIRERANVIEAHSGDLRLAAELRIPIEVRQIPGQINILHTWYRGLSNVLQNEHIVNEEVQNLHYKVYDPAFFREEIQPRIVERWNTLSARVKDWFRRFVHNMRILRQTHVVELENHVEIPEAPHVAVAPIQGLAPFTQDTQNVHRQETVKYVETIFKRLKQIPVKADQKTLAEIMFCCKLKPEAEVQMVAKYHSGAPIYEHPRAYQRALDAVWAYVRGHENKKELYIRVAEEMNDNIGMCEQGNLSRICNILCGYIDGFEAPVPQGTLVQNKIAAIAADSEGNKIARAKEALRELLVPEDQWAPWLEALEE